MASRVSENKVLARRVSSELLPAGLAGMSAAIFSGVALMPAVAAGAMAAASFALIQKVGFKPRH